MPATDVTREYRSCNCSFVNVTFSKSRFLQPHYWIKLAVMDKHKKKRNKIAMQGSVSISHFVVSCRFAIRKVLTLNITICCYLKRLYSIIFILTIDHMTTRMWKGFLGNAKLLPTQLSAHCFGFILQLYWFGSLSPLIALFLAAAVNCSKL